MAAETLVWQREHSKFLISGMGVTITDGASAKQDPGEGSRIGDSRVELQRERSDLEKVW